MVQAHGGLAVGGGGEGVRHEPPEERGLAHAVLAAQDHLLLGDLDSRLTSVNFANIYQQDRYSRYYIAYQ